MVQNNITIQTYDRSAAGLSKYFQGIGPRIDDMNCALQLAGCAVGQGSVVEIGCGDGRDAAEIYRLVEKYVGFDPSIGLLEIARKNLPQINFILSDALSFSYPENLDLVIAFASLLHVDAQEFSSVLQKVHKALKAGGIFFISLKERPEYQMESRIDEFGERIFYYYNPKVITDSAEGLFTTVYEDHKIIGKTPWLIIALKKI